MSLLLRVALIMTVRRFFLIIIIVSFVKECEKQLADAEDCFKQCDIEIRMLSSSSRTSVLQKVDTLRKECESKRRQLNNMKIQVERNDLLGGAAVFNIGYGSDI